LEALELPLETVDVLELNVFMLSNEYKHEKSTA
jgi:hypothetical protein